MYVLTAAEARRVDQLAQERLGIPSLILMENAGRSAARVAGEMLHQEQDPVVVLAGKGNNGGDGFVLARHLWTAGTPVAVWVIGDLDQTKGDARTNLEILWRLGVPVRHLSLVQASHLEEQSDLRRDLASARLIVDALFGVGLRGDLTTPWPGLFGYINQLAAPVLALDLPSGIDADTGRLCGAAIRADVTITFGFPKRGLFLDAGREYAGEVQEASLSLPVDLPEELGVKGRLLSSEYVRQLLPARCADTHKGDYGHVLVIGGARGFSGAAVLTARGALRVGAGLVTVASPSDSQPTVAHHLVEAMTFPLPAGEGGLASEAVAVILEHCLPRADCIAIGPGLTTQGAAPELVRALIENSPVPLVLDADALNCLSGQADLLRKARAPVAITPHPGEMARLVGQDISVVLADRAACASEAARRWNCQVVLKGAGTVVAAPWGELAICPTGNPGMATGGSGDVLTGIISAFLARGLAPHQACQAGVYLHGAAGDWAARELGQEAMVAGDIAESLGRAMDQLDWDHHDLPEE